MKSNQKPEVSWYVAMAVSVSVIGLLIFLLFAVPQFSEHDIAISELTQRVEVLETTQANSATEIQELWQCNRKQAMVIFEGTYTLNHIEHGSISIPYIESLLGCIRCHEGGVE